MTPARRLIQFRLRTIMFVMAAFACFLAWRVPRSEQASILAIRSVGGRVHYNYEFPTELTSWTSFMTLPGSLSFSQVQVTHSGSFAPSDSTALQLLLGTNLDNYVGAVELPLEQMTPEMIETLKSLTHLRMIVLDMPSGMLPEDSGEVRTLKGLQEEFDGLIRPAYNP